MKKLYKAMIDGIPIWKHLKNGAQYDDVKLVASDYGAFAEIVGKRILHKFTKVDRILESLFPGIEIIAVHGCPKTRILANKKIELGDHLLEIDYKNSSGKFGKKLVIFEIKHGHFQIEQNQLMRYCFMINNPDAYFPKADEVKVVFMMFDIINTRKGTASYSMSELDKELATRILENSSLYEDETNFSSNFSIYSLDQDSCAIDANIAEGLKVIME